MYLILRLLAVVLFATVMLIFGCGYCLFSPRNPKNVYTVGRWFGKMSRVFGIKLELRQSAASKAVGTCVYIANHQSNWDLVTVSNAVRPGAVTVGKKNLAYIPIFGALYWLTGNILIDRNNRSKSIGTIGQVIDKVKKINVSVWLFPEGTRSHGRGILPFKTGAFHAAIGAGVPIVPIVCSSTKNLKVSRGDNGYIIVELMDPISIEGYGKKNVRELAQHCHNVMSTHLVELDAEVTELNQKNEVKKSHNIS
ncbi:1-acylglycerol-3-phosphate O-acyltransferase [Candidatus Enterovibrio altilux]|uniref:1-acyl-sn-glycerol-3-phosphate acyltransferase n=1 Tax=Candidatus Enterovibrio altilux TaxID=1927128 RepID=A0A291B7D5_9GAMM|nr:1-acylglycerol-3-phosphate O-acyltransferase [Candidatus Enterovibrio luxaltus]ATF08910.1 1-acyl-sn-glycerol-3-phosphate acyltransferase [Candidatus Enterovibrio luxaltus]